MKFYEYDISMDDVIMLYISLKIKYMFIWMFMI